jgi:hypothetical protein
MLNDLHIHIVRSLEHDFRDAEEKRIHSLYGRPGKTGRP